MADTLILKLKAEKKVMLELSLRTEENFTISFLQAVRVAATETMNISLKGKQQY